MHPLAIASDAKRLDARLHPMQTTAMRLRAYLKEHGITASQFAVQIDRSISTVTRAMRGEVIPDKATMEKIVAATGGKVQPNDFYAPPQGGQPDVPAGGKDAEPEKVAS